MKFQRKRGSTSNVFKISFRRSDTGQGLTGVAFNTSNFILSLRCDNEATVTAYSASSNTIETISTLGTFAAPTSGKIRFKEIDATNAKGDYEIQVDDARFSVAGSRLINGNATGVANLLDGKFDIQLTATDVDDGTRGGMLALPNATTGASGSLPVIGTGTNNFKSDASANVTITQVFPANFSTQNITAAGQMLLNPTQSGLTIASLTVSGAAVFGSTFTVTGLFSIGGGVAWTAGLYTTDLAGFNFGANDFYFGPWVMADLDVAGTTGFDGGLSVGGVMTIADLEVATGNLYEMLTQIIDNSTNLDAKVTTRLAAADYSSAPSAADIDAELTGSHGAGAWTGSGSGGAGTGDIAVNHNTGGTDNLRYEHGGVGIENAVIRAYLKSDYDGGTRNVLGRSATGADGRWSADMMLDPGVYVITFDATGYALATVEVTIAS